MTTRQRRHRPEDALQRAIVEHYRQRAAPGVFMFAVPNRGYDTGPTIIDRISWEGANAISKAAARGAS